jgi:hypothetical protein
VRKPLSFWLRKIHKWVGLVIGIQVVLWAASGAGMALLDMETVTGGPTRDAAAPPLPAPGAWSRVAAMLGDEPIEEVRLRALPTGHAYQVTGINGVRLFDASTGAPVVVGAALASAIAEAGHPDGLAPARVTALDRVPLAARGHELPLWQADFADPAGSRYFVSGATGELLERRNRIHRIWDVLWMLHTMDYAKRTSFNHPLIVVAAIAMAWLAVTGFWLLFKTMWRHDLAAVRRKIAR